MNNTVVTLVANYLPLKRAVGKKYMREFAKGISHLPKEDQRDTINFAKSLKENGYVINDVKVPKLHCLDILSINGNKKLKSMINFDKNEMTEVRESNRMLMIPSWLKPPYEKLTEMVTGSLATGKAKMYKTIVEASRERGGKVVQRTTKIKDPINNKYYMQIINENGKKEYFKDDDGEWKKLFG